MFDACNFSYWPDPDSEFAKSKKFYTVEGKATTFGQVNAFIRAMKNPDIEFLDCDWILKASQADFEDIWRSDPGFPMIPLLDKRIEHLKQVASVLKEKFDGQIFNLIKTCQQDAVQVLNQILFHFPCFRDMNDGTGFFKRAQLFIWDLYNHVRPLNSACDWTQTSIDQMTIFADYRNPQSLLDFGCMSYSKELETLVKNRTILEYGGIYEVEIRAATIHISELIVELTNHLLVVNPIKNIQSVNSLIVDNFLWGYAKFEMDESKVLPYHLCRTVFY